MFDIYIYILSLANTISTNLNGIPNFLVNLVSRSNNFQIQDDYNPLGLSRYLVTQLLFNPIMIFVILMIILSYKGCFLFSARDAKYV